MNKSLFFQLKERKLRVNDSKQPSFLGWLVFLPPLFTSSTLPTRSSTVTAANALPNMRPALMLEKKNVYLFILRNWVIHAPDILLERTECLHLVAKHNNKQRCVWMDTLVSTSPQACDQISLRYWWHQCDKYFYPIETSVLISAVLQDSNNIHNLFHFQKPNFLSFRLRRTSSLSSVLRYDHVKCSRSEICLEESGKMYDCGCQFHHL